MAPKKNKKEAPTPTRRSTRIAASSRASSAAPSETDVAQPTKVIQLKMLQKKRPAKITKQSSETRTFRIPSRSLSPILEDTQEAQPPRDFDAMRNIVLILRNSDNLDKLTHAQKDAVINTLLQRESHFQTRLTELEKKNGQFEDDVERLTRERDEEKARRLAKPSLRDEFIYDKFRVAKALQKAEKDDTIVGRDVPELATNSNTADDGTSRPHTPEQESEPELEQARASDNAGQTEEPRESPPHDINPQPPTKSSNSVAGTPAPKNNLLQLARAQTELQKPRSFFSRIYNSITAPFSPVRSHRVPAPEQQGEPQQPLGELTGSRKRTFTQVEPETESSAESKAKSKGSTFDGHPTLPATPTPKMNNTQRGINSAKSTRARKPETSLTTPLTTISEQSENTYTRASAVPADTPAKPYRSISKMRREQQERERRARTPGRAWDHIPAPREPNADARLQKLRDYKKLEEEMEALKNDEELQQIIGRPTKRVKVDDLVSIPHHRPGESSSTFRVPEEDSDDEMEVDADEPVRTNIFERIEEQPETPETVDQVNMNTAVPNTAATNTAPPPWTTTAPAAPAVPAAPVEPSVQKDPEVQKIIAGFPTVGPRPAHLMNQPINKLATAKFAYGLAHYEATGEVLDLY